MSSSLNFIDLFAGAGGLSEGFIQNGFNPVAHVEMDSAACDTLKTRQAFHYLISKNDLPTYTDYLQNKIQRDVLWGKVPAEILNSVVNSEISKQTVKTIFSAIDEQRYSKKIDIIIGGPPCQAYSFVGRSRDPNGMRWDKRNFLFRRYAEFLVYFKPKYFVFENVLGLFTAGGQKYLKEMLALFEEIGFSVDFRILNAEEYGVLQKRKRVIII